jgi:hypothetical protein
MARPTRITLGVVLAAVAGCGSGTMLLWNPRTGQCNEVPKPRPTRWGRALRGGAGCGQMARWGPEGRRHGTDGEARDHHIIPNG